MSRTVQPPWPWDDVQVFLAVATRGSVANGAAHLGVNHSTVLRRISSLERAVGTRLFERLREGYALTSAGNALAQRLAGLEERIDGAHRHALGVAERIEGRIKVSASDVVVESLLLPAIAAFLRRHPQVRIDVEGVYAFASLSPAEGDIAIRGADRPPVGLVSQHVGDLEAVPCVARAWLEADARPRAWSEYRWVALHASTGFARQKDWFRARVPARSIVARFDSIVAMADAVAAGLGAGILPRALVAGRPDIAEIDAPIAALCMPVWALMHPDARHIPRVRALFEFLAETLQASTRLAHRA